MRYLWLTTLLMIISAFPVLAQSSGQGWEMKINLKKGDNPITVFSEPGHDYLSCMMDEQSHSNSNCGKLKAGWPNDTALIEPILDENGEPESQDREGVHPYYEKWMHRRWYKVNLSYEVEDPKTHEKTKVSKKGVWIESGYLSVRKKKKTSVTSVVQPPCPPEKNRSQPSRAEKETARVLSPLAEKMSRESLNAADPNHDKRLEAMKAKIKPLIGQCTFEPPLNEPKKKWNKTTSLYEAEALPLLNGKEKPTAGITKQKLVEADALARTVYAEMAQCHRYGRHQLEAVAKVIIGRAEEVEDARKLGKSSRFTNEHSCYQLNHPDEQFPVVAVIGAARQFNPWDQYMTTFGTKKVTDKKGNTKKVLDCKKKLSEDFNGAPLRQALCPPSNPDKYWHTRPYVDKKTGKVMPPLPAPPEDQEAWDTAVEIATEAIFFRDKFNYKTRDVKETEFQTQVRQGQDMSKFNNLYRVTKYIDGSPVDRTDCLILYGDKELHVLQDKSGVFPVDNFVKKKKSKKNK